MALKLNDDNFDKKVLDSKLPVFVDFFASWCGPCQVAGPVVDELADEYSDKAVIGKLDVDESPKSAQKYGVMSIPTAIVFKNGKEVKRAVGFPGKAGYEELIKAVL